MGRLPLFGDLFINKRKKQNGGSVNNVAGGRELNKTEALLALIGYKIQTLLIIIIIIIIIIIYGTYIALYPDAQSALQHFVGD